MADQVAMVPSAWRQPLRSEKQAQWSCQESGSQESANCGAAARPRSQRVRGYLRELLDDREIQAVSVATPNRWPSGQGRLRGEAGQLVERRQVRAGGRPRNAQRAASAFRFSDAEVVFDVRNLSSPNEGRAPLRGGNFVGNIFCRDQGYMLVDPYGFRIFMGHEREKTHEGTPHEGTIWDPRPHMANFVEGVWSRNQHALNAEIQSCAAAAELCHLTNISYRCGQQQHMDSRRPACSRATAWPTKC